MTWWHKVVAVLVRVMRVALIPGLLLATACGMQEGPTEPTSTPTSTGVSVTHAAEGTIFIGNEVQFEATVGLSDGSTQVASDVTWRSDAPEVATISTSGLVTAVAAGEPTISAEVAGRGGSLQIRVYPEFQGSWAGQGLVTDCTATGNLLWTLLCAGFLETGPDERRGEATFDLTQADADVGGVVDLGEDRRLDVQSGEISIDGTLHLTFDETTFDLDGVELKIDVLSWETRADTPGRMTGGFQFVYSQEMSVGAAAVSVQFENVTRAAGTGG